MGVTTYETVVNSPIPPEKLFNAGVTDVKSPHAFQHDSVFKGMTPHIDEVDKHNFSYTLTITDCAKFVDGLESISFRTKLEPSANGGSVCKTTTTFHTKAGAQISEELFKDGEKEMLEMFKTLEGQILATANA